MTTIWGGRPVGARWNHVIVPLKAGSGIRRSARRLLSAQKAPAPRLTFLLISNGSLEQLDTACRHLATALSEQAGSGDYRVVIRNSDAATALQDLVARDPADHILVDPETFAPQDLDPASTPCPLRLLREPAPSLV